MKLFLINLLAVISCGSAFARPLQSVACVDSNPTATIPVFMTLDAVSMQFRLGYLEALPGGARTPRATANGDATLTLESNRIILTGAFGTALLLHPTEKRNQYTGLVSGPIFAGPVKRITNYPLNCVVK